MFDINAIRDDFPILKREVHGRPLVYLDNAATTQKPLCVLDAMREEYLCCNANVHRGVHYLSERATELHEGAREKVRRFINAGKSSEIIFTRGTTEAVNLVASSFGEAFMKEGDEVILTVMEHHSNIVPWQLLRQRKGIRLQVVGMNDQGELRLDELQQLFNSRTKLLCVSHVSNVLGTVNPVAEIVRMGHAHDVPVLVDAAQGVPHHSIDVQAIGCDFLALSGHKVYGPTGIGILYGKEQWLEQMPPYQGGGEMISHVSFDQVSFEELPLKFEAGTPDYVATHGLGVAIDYLNAIGMEEIEHAEQQLKQYADQELRKIEELRLFGTARQKDAVFSFLVGDIHHLDMGMLLDQQGIAVRTGHHCAEPLMQRLGVSGTVRASFAFYNTKEEVDVLVNAIRRVQQMF